MSSNDSFKAQKELLEFKKSEYNALVHVMSSQKHQDQKQINQRERLQRQIQLDQAEISNYESDMSIFLHKTLEGYASALSKSDAYDLCAFRFMNIWFENQSVSGRVHQHLCGIPSFKFTSLVYQLSARLDATEKENQESSKFQTCLQKLLERMCLEHPHHTLVQIIALKNAAVDVTNKMAAVPVHKAQAAAQLLARVAKNAKLCPILESYHMLVDAYMELAKIKTPAKASRVAMQKKYKILQGGYGKIPGFAALI